MFPAAFWDWVEKTENCWLWTGKLNRDGYGRFRTVRGTPQAHKICYEELVGKVPDGLVLDHLCRVRHCVNPAHLEPVTIRENILRGEGVCAVKARQGRCRNGAHPLDGDNLYVTPDGRRQCRTCHQRRCRESRARKKSRQSSASSGVGNSPD